MSCSNILKTDIGPFIMVYRQANVVAAGSIIGKLGRKPKDTSPPRKGITIVKPANVSPSKSPASKLYAEKGMCIFRIRSDLVRRELL